MVLFRVISTLSNRVVCFCFHVFFGHIYIFLRFWRSISSFRWGYRFLVPSPICMRWTSFTRILRREIACKQVRKDNQFVNQRSSKILCDFTPWADFLWLGWCHQGPRYAGRRNRQPWLWIETCSHKVSLGQMWLRAGRQQQSFRHQ